MGRIYRPENQRLKVGVTPLSHPMPHYGILYFFVPMTFGSAGLEVLIPIEDTFFFPEDTTRLPLKL